MSFIAYVQKRKRELNPLASLFVAALSLWATPLMGAWSAIQCIYPSSPPYNTTIPSMATDINGNSVAVWVDTTGSGSLQAATLASGAFNELGQADWVLTSPVTTSNVQSTFYNFYGQQVGMDAAGNAIVTWTDGIHVYVSTLSQHDVNWSMPTTINTPIENQLVSQPHIATAANGNCVVSWISSNHAYDDSAMANVLVSGTWLGQTCILNRAVEYTLGVNPLTIDSQGNALLLLPNISNNVQAATYNIEGGSWTTIPTVASSSIIYQHGALDAYGNAIVVWTEQDASIHAAKILFNSATFTDEITLSTQAYSFLSPPLVTIDPEGNGVAIWPEASYTRDSESITLQSLGSARYSSSTGLWNLLPPTAIGNEQTGLFSLAGDSNGNVVASWLILPETAYYIQSAALAVNNSSWISLGELKPQIGSFYNPRMKITTSGEMVALWENTLTDNSYGVINSAVFHTIFKVAPPSYFTGIAIENKFLTQTERVHQLDWGASPDTQVIEYRLYRNSILIASFGAGLDFYSYRDHQRRKNSSDTYVLTCVNADDDESLTLSLTVNS